MKNRAFIGILITVAMTLGILLAMGMTASAAEYDLWIKGTQVTDENKADILGDGVLRYDSDLQVLTISGSCGSGSPDMPGLGVTGTYGSQIIRSSINGLTINVDTDSILDTSNTIESTSTVKLEGNTLIKGSGNLSIAGSSHWNAGSCYAVDIADGSVLTVEKMVLSASGDRGITGGGTLKIVSSDADLQGGCGGKPLDVGEVILERCQILPSSNENEVLIRKNTHIVDTSALNVRQGPGSDYGRIGGLMQDKEVVVLENQGEWSKIIYGSDCGWVQSRYLKEILKEVYTVSFDPNGGSGIMPDMTVQEGEKLTLPECTFTPPEGKTFDRWIAGNPGEQVEVGGDSVIRAFWKDKTSSWLPNPFEDIYMTDDYYTAVLWAYYTIPQITNGMDETHFGPQLTVTRGQAVTFLWRFMGCPEPSSMYNPFTDVSSSEYYYKPILWAVEKGITKGVDETHFNPMDTLTTQHIVTFLYRTAHPGKDGWNGEAAAWAADENGLPFGVDIAVNNVTPCPRCRVVQFLYLAD